MAFQVFSPSAARERRERDDEVGWLVWLAKHTGDLVDFFEFLAKYVYQRGYFFFSYVELVKDLIVGILYKRRGKFARPFLHTAMMSVLFVGITFGPLLVREATAETPPVGEYSSAILRSSGDLAFTTEQSEDVVRFRGGEVIEHVVEEGDTVASIAQKYNLQPETIMSENDLTKTSKIKPGDRLRILPMDGALHKVQKGETVYSVAKKYGLGTDEAAAQAIISFPFNSFANDDTFALTTGQVLFIPGGIEPKAAVAPRTIQYLSTPDAGAVSATGKFVWPASGHISQGYSWYHKAFDIANRGGGKILAADSGKIAVAGWIDNSGYGNRIMIDHGNGYVTLYAHLSAVRVKVGQSVNKGDVIGDMGSTGRSTGVHLHFEVRKDGAILSPESFLK